ncbi:MAG: 4-(cytidine 5'-diphospho)-2-C-methyl-D-erythritol kinase [Gammaproteobacteria bacterium]|nr:4-(cytidine 5'-diphospho)-2-C-methyl-D-erythritol kinase [Gammaproteobacteria bacterium]
MTDAAPGAWPAPAKLNLFLHVTGRRTDGYHELQTLFQILDWGDEIRITPTADGEIRRGASDYDVAEADDLAVRAAQLLRAESGCRQGARIHVTKRIPMGAGLGGGSSDAATVLLALNRLWGLGREVTELAELGLRLGADVPVFVHGRSALAGGVGERLDPVSLGERHYVLVLPDLAISTAEVFSDPDLKRDSRPIGMEAARAGGGRNDCEAVVRKRHPRMDSLLDSLSRWGEPRMTGTGSGIFIPMPDRRRAEETARALKSLYNVRAVRGVDRSPLHEILEPGGT